MREAAPTTTIPTMQVILVATDGSAAAGVALDEAIALAAETGEELAAVTVWRALQGDFGIAYPSAAMLTDLLDAERTHAEATLADAVSRAADAGVPLRSRLATGDPADRICAYAREIGARLIAIGSRGHGTVAALLLGSVSNAVVRNAPCPVLVVREPDRRRERSPAQRPQRPGAEPGRSTAGAGGAQPADSRNADGVAHDAQPSTVAEYDRR
jgi:nucleotide-binding universal stress UspA family protein